MLYLVIGPLEDIRLDRVQVQGLAGAHDLDLLLRLRLGAYRVVDVHEGSKNKHILIHTCIYASNIFGSALPSQLCVNWN